MPSTDFTADQQQCLLEIATASIGHGVDNGRPLNIDAAQYAEPLRAHRASFVTLQKDRSLRGCIGNLEASRALIEDVAENAYSAAFRDPRFLPVTRSELPRLDIHISILSQPEVMIFTDERHLLAQMRPGVDGLIIEVNGRRGTFLPSVWDTLPESSSFLRQLKQKIGLAEDFWSSELQVWRYTATSIPA